jgi:hypothetical protein
METQTHSGPVMPPMKILTPTHPTAEAPKPQEGVVYMQGFGEVQGRRIMIASVHFEPRSARFWHSNRRQFQIDAAPKGGVVYLPVFDSQQWVPQATSFDEELKNMVPMPVGVQTIVQDLEDAWGYIQTSQQGNFRIGIGKVAGDRATEEELKTLLMYEERMCRAVVDEADGFHKSGKGIITKFHRGCLDWLGSEKRDWYNEISLGRMKTGPLSGLKIPMEALSDAGQNLLTFYAQSGLNPLDFEDAFIAELFKTKPELKGRMAMVEAKK